MRSCVDDSTPIVIKSRDREVVMMSKDEWDSWAETMHQLDSPANIRHLQQSLDQRSSGDTVLMTQDELKKFMQNES